LPLNSNLVCSLRILERLIRRIAATKYFMGI
jgi:hypothetical protein